MSNLILIPARSGSRGIKNKNLKLINKKELIHYTINLAKRVVGKNKIIVSTDSRKILSIAKKYTRIETPFLRPKYLSSNKSKITDVAIHLLNYYEERNIFFKYLILLEPTCPFRSIYQINQMIKQTIKSGIKSAFAVTKVWHNPNEYIKIKNKRTIFYSKKIENNRQIYDKYYFVSGAIYIIDVKIFKKYKKFIFKKSIPFELSQETLIDIDEFFHLEIAKLYMKKFNFNKKIKIKRLI
jgi:CMP-N-acetylneuraminic acid synthetase